MDNAYEQNTKKVNTRYECFGTIAQLLRPKKKAKLEYLSSLTIGYLILQKVSENTEHFKKLKTLLDLGCTATLINHSVVKTLKTSKEKKLTGPLKKATAVPAGNV